MWNIFHGFYVDFTHDRILGGLTQKISKIVGRLKVKEVEEMRK